VFLRSEADVSSDVDSSNAGGRCVFCCQARRRSGASREYTVNCKNRETAEKIRSAAIK